MTDYRRYYSQGGTYFFTVNLADRSRPLLVNHIGLLRNAFIKTRREHPFKLDAIVILPEHIHALWTLPPGDADYSVRWKKIKARFSRALPAEEDRSASRVHKGERGVWQRRFWEHVIRDDDDFWRHVDYIHYNPLKHGYCQRVVDWRYSSFHRYLGRGIYTQDWAGVSGDGGDSFGE